MLGGSVEISMKNIPCRCIEDQTHFGMPRGAKLNLALKKPKCFSFKFKYYL
jgi:hypothetical protein